jgi:hypothetical protein
VTSIRWAAKLTHVRELTLVGRADLGYWRERLARESLVPLDANGHARLMIVAAEARFRGLPFREVSACVLVEAADLHPPRDRAWMMGAFNSSRLLAWCERTFFSTPYSHAEVSMSCAESRFAEVRSRDRSVLRIEMDADDPATVRDSAREPARMADDGWEGALFLPARARRDPHGGGVMFARVRGMTSCFPFRDPGDSVTLGPADAGAFRPLLESRFTGEEWQLRPDSVHARSKTFRRGEVFPARNAR